MLEKYDQSDESGSEASQVSHTATENTRKRLLTEPSQPPPGKRSIQNAPRKPLAKSRNDEELETVLFPSTSDPGNQDEGNQDILTLDKVWFGSYLL